MIRKATVKDTEDLIEAIIAIWEDMESPFITEIPLTDLKRILRKSMESQDFRYRYTNGIICERNKEVAGIAFGFKGEEEATGDTFFKQLLTEKKYHEKIDLDFERETTAGEWYLDMLYTKPEYRGKGVASELLAALPQFAREVRASKLALNCDIANTHAKRLYEKNGFEAVSEISIVGHHYDHMIKQIE